MKKLRAKEHLNKYYLLTLNQKIGAVAQNFKSKIN